MEESDFILTKAQYERIVRVLYPEPIASEMIANYNEDEGWMAYHADDPFTIAVAALDPRIERFVLEGRPERESQIRALRKHFDAELLRLRGEYFKL